MNIARIVINKNLSYTWSSNHGWGDHLGILATKEISYCLHPYNESTKPRMKDWITNYYGSIE